MPTASPEQLLGDLRSGKPLRIKVCNLGENLGQDFSYFCHYHVLKNTFPNVHIELFRSNVDETNCIGLETYKGKANLPVDRLHMVSVRQRYPEGEGEVDWATRLNRGELEIFPDWFRDGDGWDYVWGIGLGSSPVWMDQYKDKLTIGSSTVLAAMIQHLGNTDDPVLDLGETGERIISWERTRLEYLCYKDEDYPFTFTDAFQKTMAGVDSNFLRVGLRWPDHVRWYYSIDRQYEVLYEIIWRIRTAGRPVNLVYTLKDGEVGNNFNRGQSIERLRDLQDRCDTAVFTYSWPERPYHHRPSEQQELARLSRAGIRRVHRLDLWQDLLLSSQAKVYLSDPGGFAEVISMLRPAQDTFLFPVSHGHACTYITLNSDLQPVNTKINRACLDQCYGCRAVLNPPDEIPRRTTHWFVDYKGVEYQIGNDCHGDDWRYFEEAQDTAFRDMYEKTREDLIHAVVSRYVAP